jgi:hypothetical protein
MTLVKMLRVILVVTVITMLAQATFAGRMLGGDVRSLDLHQLFAKILVILAATQTIVAAASFLRRQIPRWIPLASLGLLAAEVAEFAAGDLHHVAIHVPLGVAIFGGAIRQLFGVFGVALTAGDSLAADDAASVAQRL